jgi:hypothetical protein
MSEGLCASRLQSSIQSEQQCSFIIHEILMGAEFIPYIEATPSPSFPHLLLENLLVSPSLPPFPYLCLFTHPFPKLPIFYIWGWSRNTQTKNERPPVAVEGREGQSERKKRLSLSACNLAYIRLVG